MCSGNNFNDFPENQLITDFAISLQAYLVERYCIAVPDIIWGVPQQGRLHKGGMVRDAPWRKLGGGML